MLTHLVDPGEALKQAYEALRPGGMILVQDIDCDGEFCDPASAAFRRKGELFVEAVRRRGGDPLIGRRLVRLLEVAGFSDVQSSMVQPNGRNGDVKRVPLLTFAAMHDALIELGLTSMQEIGGITAELEAVLDRPDTSVGLPRIFHAWGRKQGSLGRPLRINSCGLHNPSAEGVGSAPGPSLPAPPARTVSPVKTAVQDVLSVFSPSHFSKRSTSGQKCDHDDQRGSCCHARSS